jgi:hypothetical protein
MPQVKLTRPEIAAFAKDPRTIREIENLFSTVTALATNGADASEVAASSAQATADQAVGLALRTAQESTINAGTADAKANEALSALNRLSDAVALLALAPPRVDDRRARYGTFYDTTTQTAAAINTPYAMTFNTTDLSLGVYTGTPTSRIYVDTPGVYNIQFSAQLDKTSSPVGLIWIWPRINGVDVPNSATQIRIQGNNAESVAAWNFVFNFKTNDYFEIMWAVDDVDTRIQYFPATAFVPAIPSVLLTVTDNISV